MIGVALQDCLKGLSLALASEHNENVSLVLASWDVMSEYRSSHNVNKIVLEKEPFNSWPLFRKLRSEFKGVKLFSSFSGRSTVTES